MTVMENPGTVECDARFYKIRCTDGSSEDGCFLTGDQGRMIEGRITTDVQI